MESQGTRLFVGRLVVGLLQGLALYLLYSAFDARSWPANDGLVFAPLVIVALFIPLLLAQALGNVRALTLILWSLAAAAIVAGFAAYNIWHGWPLEWQWQSNSYLPRVLPSVGTFFFSAVFLFIGQALVVAGDSDHKIVAHYHTDFDVAWKQGLQFALAFVFLAIFWALLWLGAALFKLIALDFLEKLIEHRWFAIPATTLAIAAALHITDVRAVLVRGARSLVLALFSWLLLLIVVIAAGFLASLFGTGLEPLWKTRMATGLLLTAAAALIILINAAYQDGDAERKPLRILRLAGSLGGLMLLPIEALAGYAVYLRIGQYGWTAERIAAVACVTVAAAYAIGYAIAAVWPKDWFKPVERWNFAVSLLVLAVIAALFSPLIDPLRIGVASQLARLESGKITPEKFDFWYLRHQGGRFGKAALEKLAQSTNVKIATAAKNALSNKWPTGAFAATPILSQSDLAARIHMHPVSATLPQSFLTQDWSGLPNDCLTGALPIGWVCDAVLKDVEGSGTPNVVLTYGAEAATSWRQITVYRLEAGHWSAISHFDGQLCKGELEKLFAGGFQSVVPVQRDLQLGARRLTMARVSGPEQTCK
ncbi:MAG: DUF4153 domain-containing protein [Rhizomicrobium sp.]|nr:DUF4153 domain-containing protein [Rhizomicrobium sp.]